MHLGFIAKRFDTVGGTEKDLHELSRLLAAFGHDVHVHAAELRAPAPTGVTLHAIPVRGASRLARLQAVSDASVALTERGDYDLTISYARTARADVVRCGGGTHRAYLADMAKDEPAWKRWVRSLDPYHRTLLDIERRQFSPGMYRHVIAIADSVKRDVMGNYGVPEDRISVIFDGIDVASYRVAPDDPRRSAVRHELGIPAHAKLVVFVGNAFRRKGLDHLLYALAQPVLKDVHAIVVGRDPDSASFTSLAASLGLAARVHVVGQQDPRAAYAAADALALLSRNEAFGNVVLEALAAGLPVVVAKEVGAASILTGRLAALVVADPSNASAAADRVAAALSGPFREDAEALASRFTIEAHAKATEALLQQILT